MKYMLLHVEEPQDWPRIAAPYGELARLTGSPVVELNQAVAIAEAGEGGLSLVERLELERYHYLHATRAELLRDSIASRTPARPTTARSSSFTPKPSGASSKRRRAELGG